MANETTNVYSTDIYKLTQFVESIKSRYIDIPDETLYLGMYGYLSSIITNALENTAVVASEYSREAIPTKAKFERNVIAHALSLGINKIYANPSTIQVIIALPQDVIDGLMTNNTFTLDKECSFPIGNDKRYPFKPDYDIVIKKNVLPNGTISYSARYDIDDTNPLAEYTNPYLPAVQVQEEGSQKLLHLVTQLRQLTHSEIYKKILVNNPLETKVLSFSFSDQLAYFYVEVTEKDSSGLTTIHHLTPVYDGLYNDDTTTGEYINYMFLDESNVRLTFNRDSYQPRSNAEVTIHVFTTLGATTNFALEENYKKVGTITSTRFNYNKLYYYLIGVSDSVDGRDKLSVDQLKSIIPQEALSRGSITTWTDLNNAFNSIQTTDIHIDFMKKVDNQVERLYYAYLLLKDSNGNIVPTNSITATFNRSIFSNTNKYNFILKPGTLFYQDPDTGEIRGKANDISDAEKKKLDKNSFLYSSPFLMVVYKSPFYVAYYMTYINYTRQLYFQYLNEDSELQFICLSYNFHRDYFPTADDGDSTKDSDYIANSSDTYHLTVEATQTLASQFELFTYNSDGTIASSNVRMLAVIYQKNSSGDYVAYRYMEAKIYSHEDTNDGTSIVFEFKFKTNDVMASTGNYIYINKGFHTLNNGEEIATYITPNVQLKIFTLVKMDKEYGRTFTVNTVTTDLDSLIPNLSGWTLTNVYTTSSDEGLDIFYDYSDMCNSYVELTQDANTKDNEYTVYKIPVIRNLYLNSEERVIAINNLIERRKKYIQNVLLLLEDSFGIDYKFYNTYGTAKTYNVEDEVGIDKINLELKFEIKFTTKSGVSLLPNITTSIKEYIEDMDNISDLHMSNLITYITNLYRNDIVYIKFVRLNNYDSLYQSIYKNPELEQEEFTESQIVPEFINVNSEVDGTASITYTIKQ